MRATKCQKCNNADLQERDGSEVGGMPGIKYQCCDACGWTRAQEACEANWVPGFWRGEIEVESPVCPTCAEARLGCDEDGELYELPVCPTCGSPVRDGQQAGKNRLGEVVCLACAADGRSEVAESTIAWRVRRETERLFIG